MNKSATVIKTDGTQVKLEQRPTLNEAQNIVKGYIELLRARSSKTGKTNTLVVNEEGKLLHLPVNQAVTNEYGTSIYGRIVVGDVIVLEGWQTVGA